MGKKKIKKDNKVESFKLKNILINIKKLQKSYY